MTEQETNQILREMLKWHKLQGMKALRELIPTLLDDRKKRAVYELSDGKSGVKEISERAGVATGTISSWWTSWHCYGIVHKVKNKYVKIASIKELGLQGTSRRKSQEQ